jgi:hypothetical protein
MKLVKQNILTLTNFEFLSGSTALTGSILNIPNYVGGAEQEQVVELL